MTTRPWRITAADLAWAESLETPRRRPRQECVPDGINPAGGLGGCRQQGAGFSVFPGVDLKCRWWACRKSAPSPAGDAERRDAGPVNG